MCFLPLPAAELLQAGLQQEEIPQVCVLPLRHRGDDGLLAAGVAQTEPQRHGGVQPHAAEHALQLAVGAAAAVAAVLSKKQQQPKSNVRACVCVRAQPVRLPGRRGGDGDAAA